jgi:isoleucyl-tRNA synthetase
MWVSSEDYRDDVSISQTSIQQISTAYRRIRNTLRFVLGNLFDFDPKANAVAYEELGEDDRWCLHQLNDLIRRVTEAYDKFEFHRVYQLVNGFCVTELGSLYLDMTKDRLYCSGADDLPRRASQTVMHEIGSVLPRLMAPILVYTADEAWESLPGNGNDCVHLADFPKTNEKWNNEELHEKWERLLVLRGEVTRAIEPLRAKENKVIGNSLEAKVTLRSRDPETIGFIEANLSALPAFFIVSQVDIDRSDAGSVSEELRASGLHLSVEVVKAEGEKCPRCWKRAPEVGSNGDSFPELCERCADVMRRKSGGEKG